MTIKMKCTLQNNLHLSALNINMFKRSLAQIQLYTLQEHSRSYRQRSTEILLKHLEDQRVHCIKKSLHHEVCSFKFQNVTVGVRNRMFAAMVTLQESGFVFFVSLLCYVKMLDVCRLYVAKTALKYHSRWCFLVRIHPFHCGYSQN